jgi:hypothetical protein
MSSRLNPPVAVKNLQPLRCDGRWLAVSITAPSQAKPGVTVLMNMAGVDAMPKSSTRAPPEAIPSISAVISGGPLIRLSRPADTVNPAASLPRDRTSQWTKARPRRRITSGVRFTAVAETPSAGIATPRMSEPFCSAFQSMTCIVPRQARERTRALARIRRRPGKPPACCRETIARPAHQSASRGYSHQWGARPETMTGSPEWSQRNSPCAARSSPPACA